MIARPQRRSTAAACAFMVTSSAPLATPRTKAAETRAAKPDAACGNSRDNAKPSAASRVARAAPCREATSPATGITRIAPAAKASRARLSALAVSMNRALRDGMAAAQAPMPSPLAKKTSVTAARSADEAARAPTDVLLTSPPRQRSPRARRDPPPAAAPRPSWARLLRAHRGGSCL